MNESRSGLVVVLLALLIIIILWNFYDVMTTPPRDLIAGNISKYGVEITKNVLYGKIVINSCQCPKPTWRKN